LAIIYLIVAAGSIALSSNRPKVDFGQSNATKSPDVITGMQDCNMAGAASLSIISIIIAFLGAGIYVRTNSFNFAWGENYAWGEN
jgi:hypothetical protein